MLGIYVCKKYNIIGAGMLNISSAAASFLPGTHHNRY
jgi:hypothetical protein